MKICHMCGGVKEVSELTKEFYSKQSFEQRQKLGQFYTPRTLINKAFETIDLPEDAAVLEPTAGSGEFVKALLERGFTNITANEFDDAPYEILVENYEPEGVTITQGDYLTKKFPKKFDLVIGNPPYFMFRGKHGIISEEVREKYKDVIKGTANIYVLSTVKGLMDLKFDGILSYVIPTSILGSPIFQKARNWIAERANIERVEIHTERDEFEGANVEVMIFQLRKKRRPNMNYKKKVGSNYFFLKTKEAEEEEDEAAVTIGSLSKFKTGPIDISKIPRNKREEVLSDERSDDFYPIIYNENIYNDRFRTDVKLKKGRKQYLSKDYKPGAAIQPPFLIARRSIGTKKDLKVALVTRRLNQKKYYPENHTYWAKGNLEDLRRVHDVLTAERRPFLNDVNSLSISSALINSVKV